MQKINLKAIVGLIIIGLIGYFVFNSNSTANNKKADSGEVNEFGFKSVGALEFKDLINEGNGFLVDVHIPEQTHIPGTDAFIPYNEISDHLDKLPEDKNTPLLVYCRSGSMSREASTELVGLGYTNVYDLKGGINEFKESNTEVVITPETIDLGTVVYGDVARTDFTLTNFTPAALNITRVSTSCGCTKAEVSKEKLDPYDTTAVKVSFDPAVYKDDTDLGDITRTIYIETDNPNFPKITSTITAHVVIEN